MRGCDRGPGGPRHRLGRPRRDPQHAAKAGDGPRTGHGRLAGGRHRSRGERGGRTRGCYRGPGGPRHRLGRPRRDPQHAAKAGDGPRTGHERLAGGRRSSSSGQGEREVPRPRQPHRGRRRQGKCPGARARSRPGHARQGARAQQRGGAEHRQRTARLRAGGREGTRAREGRAGARAGSPGAGGGARGGGRAGGPGRWGRGAGPAARAGGCLPPRGYLSVSSICPEEHGIEGPVPQPPGGTLVGPAQPPVHLPHQGEGLLPERVRDRAPVPVPRPGPLCPSRRLPLLPLCLRRRCRAPPPLRRGHLRRLRSWRGGPWLVLGSWGSGGDELASVRVDVVEVVVVVVVVVVVGVVRRHLLGAGGNAPHRLHVRLRGRPAARPPPFGPPSPLGSHAPSRLSLGAHGTLALALGPLSSPRGP